MATRRSPLSKALKSALSNLSSSEKDKLLFRLLPKNPALVAELEFKLVEDGDTQSLRREELAERIVKEIQDDVPHYYSPGYLLVDLRRISGDITRHVKTTKDKYGEIKLNLLMLNTALGLLGDEIAAAPRGRSRTLNEYVVKRTLKIYALLDQQHPDLLLDFKADLMALGKNISGIDSMMKTAIMEMLDVNWLLRGEMPGY